MEWIVITDPFFILDIFLKLYLHSMEKDWYREIPEYLSVFNETGQAWEWEDEQGFSALRHSGEKSADVFWFPANSLYEMNTYVIIYFMQTACMIQC